MEPSFAAWCVVPGETGCRVSAAISIATGNDVLIPNCWGACWDENTAFRDSGATSQRVSIGRFPSRIVEKNITLAKKGSSGIPWVAG